MNTTYNVVLDDQQLREVKALAMNRNKSINEMIDQIFTDGLKDKLYRYRRNQQRYQEMKGLKEKVAELESALMKLPMETLEQLTNEVVEEEV